MSAISIQDQVFPGIMCFGCGRSNPNGLGLESFVDGEAVVADWTPDRRHDNGFGFLSGGVIATLMDCHIGALVAWQIIERFGGSLHDHLFVTSDLNVKYRRPTPLDQPLRIVARLVNFSDDQATVQSTLSVAGQVTASASAIWRPLRTSRDSVSSD